ncbi:MAG: preprotein translocase subunit YajC [Sciscionella sp.]
MIILVLAVPMFLSVRKQKKQAQQQQAMQSSITIGDRIMTTSGLFGTVVDTSEDSIDIEIAPGVETTWLKAAVREKVNTDDSTEVSEYTGDTEDTDAYSADESGAQLAQPIEHEKNTR